MLLRLGYLLAPLPLEPLPAAPEPPEPAPDEPEVEPDVPPVAPDVPPVPPLPTVPLELPPTPVLLPVLPVEPAPVLLPLLTSSSHFIFASPVIAAQSAMVLALELELPLMPEPLPLAPVLELPDVDGLVLVPLEDDGLVVLLPVDPLLPVVAEGLELELPLAPVPAEPLEACAIDTLAAARNADATAAVRSFKVMYSLLSID